MISTEVKLFWKPINQHLLELNGEINGVLVERAKYLSSEVGKGKGEVGSRKPVERVLPMRVHLGHMVDHMLGPRGEVLDIASESTKAVTLAVHVLRVPHVLLVVTSWGTVSNWWSAIGHGRSIGCRSWCSKRRVETQVIGRRWELGVPSCRWTIGSTLFSGMAVSK